MKSLPIVAALAFVVACEPVQTSTPAPQTEAVQQPRPATPSGQVNFAAVVRVVEPVAEQECRARAPDLNCDFKIIIEADKNAPPNAYQTIDRSGRPIIGFTQALIDDARNADELAFVLGHEAAHHIEGHLQQQAENATAGALLGGILAAGLGVPTDLATQVGGTVGARAYSKSNELEADALGTIITKKTGFDPLRGAQFFTRIPDPGDRFLGTHPPNAERIAIVRRVNAGL
ncbi:MAG: M48 family metallopeptidase [Litoreibacter sp.]